MISTNPLADDLSALRAELDGQIVLPGEEAFDEARQAWNRAADQQPALVGLPRTAEDVQALVAYARRSGLRVAMQGTGHNATPLGDLGDTVLIKTQEMRAVGRRHDARVPARPRPAGRLRPRRRRGRLHAGRRPELAGAPLRPRGRAPAGRGARDRRRALRARRATTSPSSSGRCAAAAATSERSRRSSSS